MEVSEFGFGWGKVGLAQILKAYYYREVEKAVFFYVRLELLAWEIYPWLMPLIWVGYAWPTLHLYQLWTL